MRISFLLLCSLSIAACSSKHEDDPIDAPGAAGGASSAGGASGTGRAGSAGGIDDYGGAGGSNEQHVDAGDPYRNDSAIEVTDAAVEDAGPSPYETLLECEAEAPCATSIAYVIENQRTDVDKPSFECVFSKLAARVSGKYVHETSHSFSNGSGKVTHTFLVQEDGSVLYGSSKHATVSNLDEDGSSVSMVESWQRVQRCELMPASYFDDCQAKLATDETTGNNAAWMCTYGTFDISLAAQMPWVTSCEEVAELTCP